MFIIFWIVIQGFFSPIIILICILFDYVSSVIILSVGSGIGSFFVYKFFKIKSSQIKIFEKAIKFLNKNPFLAFLFIRLSGGLGLPNQIQILLPTVTRLTNKNFIIANFFGQLPGFMFISYFINSMNISAIRSFNDIKINNSYLITAGILVFIIFIIPIIFKRIFQRSIK